VRLEGGQSHNQWDYVDWTSLKPPWIKLYFSTSYTTHHSFPLNVSGGSVDGRADCRYEAPLCYLPTKLSKDWGGTGDSTNMQHFVSSQPMFVSGVGLAQQSLFRPNISLGLSRTAMLIGTRQSPMPETIIVPPIPMPSLCYAMSDWDLCRVQGSLFLIRQGWRWNDHNQRVGHSHAIVG